MKRRAQKNFTHGTAEIIAAVGSSRFWPRLCALFSKLVDHHGCVVFRFGGDDAPECVFGNLICKVSKNKFQEYRHKAYLLDPFYALFKAHSPDGIVKLKDVSADRFFHSVYYKEYYRKTGFGDEGGIFCWTSDNKLVVVSLTRLAESPPFGQEFRIIGEFLPIIIALIKRHEELASDVRSGKGSAPAKPKARFERESAALIPSEGLTTRELDIAELILKGHSSLSVSLVLGISIETVRVHRRHLYKKLQVTSQTQLFALAMR